MSIPLPPAISPTSGMYCPPVCVTIAGEIRQGDVLFYTILDTNADPAKFVGKQRYQGPVVLNAVGRVKIVAHIWRPSVGEGTKSSALYLLDRDAPPPSKASDPRYQGYFNNRLLLETTALVPDSTLAIEEAQPVPRIEMLHFLQVPSVIVPLKPFHLSIQIVDVFGHPLSKTLHDPSIAITVDNSSTKTVASTIVACEGIKQEPICHGLPFAAVSNILLIRSEQGHSLYRAGKGGMWDSFATSEPCIGLVNTAGAGIGFSVVSLTRSIVGLYDNIPDPNSETSWKHVNHAFHFSADINDPTSAASFRVYEMGQYIASVGTRDFVLGDYFYLHIRPNGVLEYVHDEEVVFVSPRRVPSTTTYSCIIRIASQQSTPALSNLHAVGHQNPEPITIKSLVWKPAMAEGNSKDEEGILRAWIVGSEVFPATQRVTIQQGTIPKWASAALTLSAMFILGSLGCQGNHVAEALKVLHNAAPQLAQSTSTGSDNAPMTSPDVPTLPRPGLVSPSMRQASLHPAPRSLSIEEDPEDSPPVMKFRLGDIVAKR